MNAVLREVAVWLNSEEYPMSARVVVIMSVKHRRLWFQAEKECVMGASFEPGVPGAQGGARHGPARRAAVPLAQNALHPSGVELSALPVTIAPAPDP